jgi:hypothetical protein
MGQFKPMVKMMTDEPSVILKLKKGGGVKQKMKEDHGHMAMNKTEHHKKHHASQEEYAEQGEAPKKPSMAERRKAMSGVMLNSKKGGNVDMAQDKAMIKKAFKQHDMQEHKGGKGTSLKLKKGGMMKGGMACADGGEIDSKMDKTTIKGNAGKFLKTKVVDGDKNDSAKSTGKAVKNGNAGGYATGGTIQGNAGKFLNTKVNDGDKNDSAKSTGKAVKMGNNGGYATGGTIRGGSWENRPADTAKAGKSGTTTGGVRNGNAGGY